MGAEKAADNVSDVCRAERPAESRDLGPPRYFDEGGVWLKSDANRRPGGVGVHECMLLEALWGRSGEEALGPNQ